MRRALVAAALLSVAFAGSASAHTLSGSVNCNTATLDYRLFPSNTPVTQTVYVNGDVYSTYSIVVSGSLVNRVTLALNTSPEATYNVHAEAVYVERGRTFTLRTPVTAVTCGVPLPPAPPVIPPTVPPVAPEPPVVSIPPVVVPPGPPVTPPKRVNKCPALILRRAPLRVLIKAGCARKCPKGTFDVRRKDGKWVCIRPKGSSTRRLPVTPSPRIPVTG